MKKLLLVALCSLIVVSGLFAQASAEKAEKSGPYLIKLANTQEPGTAIIAPVP